MRVLKPILASPMIAIAIVGVAVALPAETRTQSVQASQPVTECPPPTSEGAYHVQGYDKVTGDVVCGSTYFNECPYAAGYSAKDPMCDKLKAQQEPQPVQPVTPAPSQPVNQCGGK